MHTNALIHEASPYLLQHAHNPVNWQPWSDEAFERAKRESKPVFLSVGYAACHWCHVMAHESFENDSIAAFLNEHFISIKVDREERPDIDHHYMQAVQQMTGSGGWPMSVFLTPDRRPFFGGTYWPPVTRYGRPGFMEVLHAIQAEWQHNRPELSSAADSIHTRLAELSRITERPGELSPALFKTLVRQSAGHFDSAHGGFGPAPKFPHAMELAMLLREYARSGDEQARRMVEHTLTKMTRGGIYDHLGGGFARYSTDAKWLVPHFEKMLYDNALLIPLYLDASLAFERTDFRQTAVECLEWALREMEMPEGGFASSLDADSEGEEGKYYVWTPEQIDRVLGAERGERFSQVYGVTQAGNFEQGTSILNLDSTLETWAVRFGIPTDALHEELRADRSALLKAREERIRPGKDEKVLTDWNGLFLSALVRGFAVTGDERYLRSAVKCADRLLTPFESDGDLVHSFLGEREQRTQLLLDYTAFGNGLLDLFAATGESRWFGGAFAIVDSMHERFANPEGLYYLSASGVAGTRSVDPYDNAMPSGNSMAGNLLARLHHLTGDGRFLSRAEAQVVPLTGYFELYAPNFAQAVRTAELLIDPPLQLVLVQDDARVLWKVAQSHFLPGTEIIHASEKMIAELTEESPLYSLLSGKTALDFRATAYLCRNFVCERPIVSAHELRAQLKQLSEPVSGE